MLFHRRQDAQIALHPSGVVIMDIVLDRLNKLPLTGETPAVIAFPLQNAPEALHRAVINAMRHTEHTLRHAGLHELVVESAVGVLESSVTMEQGMRVRIGFHSLINGLENQRIVIAFAEHIGHDEQLAGQLNGISLFSVRFPDRSVDASLSYFRKASLLSISSNFFSRSRSISARYSLCLSCSISICAFSSSVLGT